MAKIAADGDQIGLRRRIQAMTGYLWLRLTGFLLLGLVTAHIIAEFVLRGALGDPKNKILSIGITVFVVVAIIHGMFGWQRVVDDLGVADRGRTVLLWFHVLVGALLILAALVILGQLGIL